jgi:hypothetical protein
MIHDLEDLKVNFEMKIGNTLKELSCFVFFYFEIVRYLFFHVMPLKYPDTFAPFLPVGTLTSVVRSLLLVPLVDVSVTNINLKLQITSLHFRNPHLH